MDSSEDIMLIINSLVLIITDSFTFDYMHNAKYKERAVKLLMTYGMLDTYRHNRDILICLEQTVLD